MCVKIVKLFKRKNTGMFELGKLKSYLLFIIN